MTDESRCFDCEMDRRAENIELTAWRFLAAHRVGSLNATHVAFIDERGSCRMNTPCAGAMGVYEDVTEPTFGEAAIALALKLGMPCIDSDVEPIDSDPDTSSAATADSGESEPSTPLTRSELVDSTTGATGAAENIAGGEAR